MDSSAWGSSRGGEIWKEKYKSKGGEDESWRGGRMGEEEKTKGGEEEGIIPGLPR